jgi:hypothetical protein
MFESCFNIQIIGILASESDLPDIFRIVQFREHNFKTRISPDHRHWKMLISFYQTVANAPIITSGGIMIELTKRTKQ